MAIASSIAATSSKVPSPLLTNMICRFQPMVESQTALAMFEPERVHVPPPVRGKSSTHVDDSHATILDYSVSLGWSQKWNRKVVLGLLLTSMCRRFAASTTLLCLMATRLKLTLDSCQMGIRRTVKSWYGDHRHLRKEDRPRISCSYYY